MAIHTYLKTDPPQTIESPDLNTADWTISWWRAKGAWSADPRGLMAKQLRTLREVYGNEGAMKFAIVLRTIGAFPERKRGVTYRIKPPKWWDDRDGWRLDCPRGYLRVVNNGDGVFLLHHWHDGWATPIETEHGSFSAATNEGERIYRNQIENWLTQEETR